MDLSFSKSERAFRDEARAWLEENVPKKALLSGDSREGFAQHVEWEKTLFDARWSVVSWPEQYGGRGASLVEWLIFEEEYWRAGAPNHGLVLRGDPEGAPRHLRIYTETADRVAQMPRLVVTYVP